MKKVCQRVREQIPELVSGALGPEKAGELRRHIGACPTCGEYLRCLKADDKQLRDYVKGMQSTLARLEDGVIEALGREPSREPIGLVSIWKALRKSTIAKISAAALIIIVALIGVEILVGPHKKPAPGTAEVRQVVPSKITNAVALEGEDETYPADTEVRVREDDRLALAGEPESGVASVEEMIAAGDIEGLAAILDEGEVESRMTAAYYLASIGETRGLAALKELLPIYIAGDPNKVIALVERAKGLAVDKREVSDRWAVVALEGHKDRDTLRLDGEEVVVRLYRDWRAKPTVFETVSVKVAEGSLDFDSIVFGSDEIGETVVAVFGEDQTDVNVAEAVGDCIYAVSYEKGTRLPLPCADMGRHKEATLIFKDATPGPDMMLGMGGRIRPGEPMAEGVVEIFVQAYEGPRIQVGKYVLDAGGSLNVPSAIGSLNQFVFIVSHPRYGMAQVDWYPRGGTSVVSVPLVREDSIARDRAIWGTIVDSEDNPVVGAVVECSHVRTLGEGLINAADGSCKVVSDANGFFTCYMPNEKRRDDRGLLIPPRSRYHVKIEAPKELELLPYVGGIMNGQEITVVMERSNYFHTFVFEDDSGPITDPERLKTISVIVDQQEEGQLSFGYDNWKDGGRFPLGEYRAGHYGRREEIGFEALEVTEDSPEELVFRLQEGIVYHGRVVEALTSEPMEGAFVVSMWGTKEGNLSHITGEQWELLHELPGDPCAGDKALEPIDKIYGFSKVVRADANGRFEMTFLPGDRVYGFVSFEEDYLGVMHRKHALEVDENRRAEVPVIKLYPAAKIMIEPRVEPNKSKGTGEAVVTFEPTSRTGIAEARVSIWPRWAIDREDNPAWVNGFLATDDRSERLFTYDKWLRQNEAQSFHVPAGLNVRIRLEAPYDDQWCPIVFDETINLAQGEVLDLGRVNFQPALKVLVKVVNSVGEPIEGVPVSKRVGDGGWHGPHNSDEKGVCRFNLCPYTEGEFGVHYEGEEDLDLRESIPYEVAGPNDANSVYTFQISDEMLDHLFR